MQLEYIENYPKAPIDMANKKLEYLTNFLFSDFELISRYKDLLSAGPSTSWVKFNEYALLIIGEKFQDRGYSHDINSIHYPTKKIFTFDFILDFDVENKKIRIGFTEKAMKEKEEQDLFQRQHQLMLSAIVTRGFENLSDEEKCYWNSVY